MRLVIFIETLNYRIHLLDCERSVWFKSVEISDGKSEFHSFFDDFFLPIKAISYWMNTNTLHQKRVCFYTADRL